MNQHTLTTDALSKLKCTLSPALFAQYASRGRWKMARHLKALNRALEQMASGQLSRLIVEMPPRHGKSELLGKYLPAWYLGTFPQRQVIYASYGAQQAHKYGRLARQVFAAHAPQVFGLKVAPDAHSAAFWGIAGHDGGMFATGVDGPLTGKGAHLLVVDDPIKNHSEAWSPHRREAVWEWFQSTAMTRLEPGGAVIVNMTRWHKEDLVGQLRSAKHEEPWRVLSFPAICEAPDELGRQPGEALWPERFPLHDRPERRRRVLGLETLRQSMALHWWLALYQQRPGERAGTLWPEEYFAGDDLWFDQWPVDLLLRVMTLDPSKGAGTRQADYSAYVLLGVQAGGLLWVGADLSNRRPPSQLVADGVELVTRFRPDVFRVESNAWQELLQPLFEEALRARGLTWFKPGGIHNQVHKSLRIEKLDDPLSARIMRFRRTPGTELLVQQLKEFPLALHDDGPDALEMAVRIAMESWAEAGSEKLTDLRSLGEF